MWSCSADVTDSLCVIRPFRARGGKRPWSGRGYTRNVVKLFTYQASFSAKAIRYERPFQVLKLFSSTNHKIPPIELRMFDKSWCIVEF